jgi:hypothetical protein
MMRPPPSATRSTYEVLKSRRIGERDCVSSNYDEVWNQIRDSPMAMQYRWELFWLAHDVVSRAAAVVTKTPPPRAGEDYLKVDFDIHGDIFALLGAAAKIKALITPKKQRDRRNQSDAEYHVQRQRATWLASLLDGIDLTEVSRSAVRHTLEHFDQYVDRTAIRLYEDRIKKPAHLPTDMVFSSRRAFEPLKGDDPDTTIYPIRAYIADERRFLNCGKGN